MDYDDISSRLQAWSHDERLGDGMLLRQAADAITALQARVAELETTDWRLIARNAQRAYNEAIQQRDRAEAELAATRALLREIREQGYRKEMTARIDSALAGERKP